MEEKDSAISGPYEEFRICFCGENIRSGYVEWYVIDVSVEEACVSEKTESGTRELTPFSVAKHLPSYAALDGLIYSLGGQRRSDGGGDTLLNDVWLLDFKSLEVSKPGSIPPLSFRDELAPGEKNWQPERKTSELMVENRKVMRSHDILPDSDKACPTPLTAPSVEDWKPGLPMKFARYNPHTMVVDHKLYVLGGFLPNQNQADGWIEVFDPEEKKWESLPSPPDQIHSSILISGLLKSKKEIIITKQRWDRHPMLFYSYNIPISRWNTVVPDESEASVHSNVEGAVILPPNAGRAVTVGNTLYWISTEEDNHECTIHAYDLDRKMWFEDHLNTATIFGRREYFSSIYSRGPGFLHLVDQKFCLLLQSSFTKKGPQSSIEYLYCVILDISPIYNHEHEDWGKFELTIVSVQKYSMDHYIDFLDCMLLLGARIPPEPKTDQDALSALKDGEVISIHSISELEPKLDAASKTARLAILYFTATWCHPSLMISPLYTSLADKYPKVVFLKVDIDEAKDLAALWNFSAFPTFLFFKNGKEVDRFVGAEVVGAEKSALERKIEQHAG